MMSKIFANMNICALFEFGRTDLGHIMQILLWRFGASVYLSVGYLLRATLNVFCLCVNQK